MRTNRIATILTLIMVSGCAGISEKASNNVDQTDTKATQFAKEVGHTAPAGAVGNIIPSVEHEDGIWLGKNVVKIGPPPLPSIFYEQATFDRIVYSLSELAERLTLRTGIPTKVSPDALAISNGAPQAAPQGVQSQSAIAPIAAMPGLPPAGTQNLAKTRSEVHISYSNGDLKGLLDTVAARYGVYWKYANNAIQFYYTDSRTFQIDALPGDSTLTSNVTSQSSSAGGGSSGGSGGGSSGGGSGAGGTGGVSTANGQSTGITSQLSVFSSIEKAVHAMLSTHGRVVSSPATGSMTVVDTPDSLDRVAAFIESENKALSKQITINVTVLSVTLNDADNYGINWNLAYNYLSQFGVTNPSIPAIGSTNTTAAPTPGQFSGSIINPNSKYTGSKLVINALSQQGKVRQETSASVVTLNNQPVPVQVATQQAYLASQTITQNAAGIAPTVTNTPGSVTYGFNMTILPHVLNNGTILLQFSADISNLDQIATFGATAYSSGIQTPVLDTRNFLQRVSMKSNETLIISGFEQTNDSLNKNGVGTAGNYIAGGGFTGENSKQVIVILITPTTNGS